MNRFLVNGASDTGRLVSRVTGHEDAALIVDTVLGNETEAGLETIRQRIGDLGVGGLTYFHAGVGKLKASVYRIS